MEDNIKPICDLCKKESPIEWEESNGYTGAKLVEAGWIYKNAILFTGKNTPLCFCSDNCQKQYYSDVLNVSKEKSKEIKDWADKCKEDFKKDIPKIQERMQNLSDALRSIKKNG